MKQATIIIKDKVNININIECLGHCCPKWFVV